MRWKPKLLTLSCTMTRRFSVSSGRMCELVVGLDTLSEQALMSILDQVHTCQNKRNKSFTVYGIPKIDFNKPIITIIKISKMTTIIALKLKTSVMKSTKRKIINEMMSSIKISLY